MVRMLKLYIEAGFDGYIRPDHCPAMAGEANLDERKDSLSSGYEMKGRLFAVGYIRGILDSIS
jgi:mannonate dehydratase